jgi:hypothetical protein
MISGFNLFRTKMNNEASCRQKFETRFITDGAAPIKITILRLDKDRDATMVFTEAEGPDAAIVFTPKQPEQINNLLKTDYFTWEDKTFFVYEDVIIPREIAYIKQRAYQCNVRISFEDCEQMCDGYFISSLRSYVDTELQQKINISDKEHPILIVPRHEWVKVGTKIIIGDKPWKIIDYDAITNPGIAYISLERNFFKKGTDVSEYGDDSCLKAGIEHTVMTQDGYFNSSSPLTIKLRTSNKVVFEVPYGIDKITIETKNYNGIIHKQEYKVVL